MILCCSSPMVPGDTLTAKGHHLREWGYDAMAVFQDYAAWDDAARDELRQLETRTGVRPVEFVLTDAIYGHAMSSDPVLREACRTMYREAGAVCAELGLVTEIEYQYGPQDPMPLFDPYQQLTVEEEAAFTDFYREMLGIVDGTDGWVLLEPLNRYESRYLNTVEDNLRVVTAVDHPRAGLLPDTFHMSIEEADIPSALRRSPENVRHVHFGENNRLLPGRGTLPWPEIVTALRDIEYAGAVNLECSTSGDPARTLPETAAFLRSLITR